VNVGITGVRIKISFKWKGKIAVYDGITKIGLPKLTSLSMLDNAEPKEISQQNEESLIRVIERSR